MIKKIPNSSINKKKAEVVIYVSDREDFRANYITRDKKCLFIMINVKGHMLMNLVTELQNP